MMTCGDLHLFRIGGTPGGSLCVPMGRSYSFYGKLDQVEQEVGRGFVRIHQRYLIRAGAVERFGGNEVCLGDVVLPVSRSCQQQAMLALARNSLED